MAKRRDDAYDMSLASQTEYGGYKVHPFNVKEIGEQTSDAKISHAGELPYAGVQMSDGSMDYLSKNAGMMKSDVNKVKRSMKRDY